MNTDPRDSSYYIVPKTILRAIGHWPYQSKKETILCRIVMYILCTAQIGPQIVAVIHHSDDAGFIMEAISSFATNIAVFVNFITFHVHADKIKSLLEHMKEDWDLFPNSNGLNILRYHSELGRRLTILYAVSCFAAAVAFVTEPLHSRMILSFLEPNKTIPLTFAIPVDYGDIDIERYYWILLTTCGLCIFGIVNSAVSANVALFMYAQHACGLFGALGFAIENLPVDEDYGQDDGEYEYQYLRRCIQIHSRILAFSDTIEDIYTWNFLNIVGLGILAISMTAVQVVYNLKEVGKLIKMFLYTMAEIVHLFVACIMAQRIFDASLKINECLMSSRWYYSKPRTKLLLQFMTMRSQIPSQLTAGKVMFMCLGTFTVLMKTSGSYFTVFVNMQ